MSLDKTAELPRARKLINREAVIHEPLSLSSFGSRQANNRFNVLPSHHLQPYVRLSRTPANHLKEPQTVTRF